MPPAVRRVLTLVATLVVMVTAVGVPPGAGPATAADLRAFDPGMIISDVIFYDSTVMDAGQVQAFLADKGSACVAGPGNIPCLKDYRQDTTTWGADTQCPAGYVGRAAERASDIITNVARSCGISPRVLLVLLQKEQGLVRASGASLTISRYQKATGYGCPDTAACNPKFAGFANQVYMAAWAFKNYALTSSTRRYQPGKVNQVLYHPSAACGQSGVLIRNQATASLYNYTPYQPNAAALAAGYGTGDSCSSYGNRNFWNYFTDWFGTTSDYAPVGSVDWVSGGADGVTVAGWAVDPDTSQPIAVHLYVDGVATVTTADDARSDVGALFPGRGDRHGFTTLVPAAEGTRTVCAYAINVGRGPNTLIGCRTASVVNRAPLGHWEVLTGSPAGIELGGWAFDPDTAAPIAVHVYVDGVGTPWVANAPRADIAARYPGQGDRHGFAGTLAASPGPHVVCVYPINATPGPNASLGCLPVTVPAPVGPANRAPVGSLDSVTAEAQEIRVTGWAFDPDTAATIGVHVYVDGAGVPWTASAPRPDVKAQYPGQSPNHGFDGVLAAAPGPHTVCVYAMNATAGANTALGCRTVTTTLNRPPMGVLESVTGGGSSIVVSGYAFDPDSVRSIPVHVYVDGIGVPWTADVLRPDVKALYPGQSDRHGFRGTLTAAPGRHTVCAYAINATAGPATGLGCRDVEVS